MKVLVLLLLLSLQGYAEGKCGQEKKFTIIKNDTASVYQLQLCTSTGGCTTPITLTLLNEQRSCNDCAVIPRKQDQNCCETSECVDHINTFFSNYCEIFDQCVTCTPFTPQTITPTACTNGILSTVTTKVTTEGVPTHTEQSTVASIAALLGLFLVILVLVVTGWVWTCWTMKKMRKETQLCINCQVQESVEDRFCLNHIHKMPSTQPVVAIATEQLLDSLEESGHSNNGLSSKDNKGHCDVKRVENLYTSSEGSSNSSLQQEEAVNRTEEGESGEKHVYHVLEKPRGDDYEDSDKDLEENTAIEYETPLPLKEVRLKHASIHTHTN